MTPLKIYILANLFTMTPLALFTMTHCLLTAPLQGTYIKELNENTRLF